MNQDRVQNYFLIYGELEYQDPEKKEEPVRRARLNGILASPESRLPLKALGRCQEILQMVFHSRHKERKIPYEVLDVVIHNLTPLGRFNPKDFHAGVDL